MYYTDYVKVKFAEVKVDLMLRYFTFQEENDRTKSIFIHIPKSAGTSISQKIFGRTFGHRKLIYYQQANRPKFDVYFKFTFVRNPWSRFHSAFCYLKEKRGNKVDIAWANLYLKEIETFDDFCENMRTNEKFQKIVMKWRHFIPQFEFLINDSGNLEDLNFIGRMENIDEDFKILANRFDIDNSLKKINMSSSSDDQNYRGKYNDSNEKLVRHLYEKDINLLNYSF